VTSVKNQTLSRIDARTGELTTSGEYAAGQGVALGGDWVWVVSERRNIVTRVSPRSLGEVEQLRLAGRPGDLGYAFGAVGGGSLWLSQFPPTAVTRWNLETHRLERRYQLGGFGAGEIMFGERAAWVPLFSDSELLRIDAATGSTTRFPVGAGPTDPVLGFGSVWVASLLQGSVWRLEPFTGQVQQVIPVGRAPFGLAVGAGSVWVTDSCDGTVARIDPKTNEVTARIETGHIPRWLAVGAGHVWVGVTDADVFHIRPLQRCKGSTA
jgi:YVTN family beta-propeller protein